MDRYEWLGNPHILAYQKYSLSDMSQCWDYASCKRPDLIQNGHFIGVGTKIMIRYLDRVYRELYRSRIPKLNCRGMHKHEI